MPLYTFEAKDGQQIERYYEMSEVPPIGSAVRVKGKDGKTRTFRRVLDWGRTKSEIVVPNWEFASWQTPLYDPLAPRHDAVGRTVILTKAEAREYSRGTTARDGGRGFTIEE